MVCGAAEAHPLGLNASRPASLCFRFPFQRIPITTGLTDRILRQARALVRAIEALGTIEPSDASSARTLWHYEPKRIDSDLATKS
jgi:hypothetical protein